MTSNDGYFFPVIQFQTLFAAFTTLLRIVETAFEIAARVGFELIFPPTAWLWELSRTIGEAIFFVSPEVDTESLTVGDVAGDAAIDPVKFRL